MSAECKGGAEVGRDWSANLVLHENDADWHEDPEMGGDPRWAQPPAEQAVPIPGDWPKSVLVQITETLADLGDVATRAMMLAETAQGDADALHAAALDCLDIFETADTHAAGRTQLATNQILARAAKEMALRLRSLAGPNVSRET